MCAGIIPSVVRLSPRIMNKKISPTRLKLVYEPIESLVGLFLQKFLFLT